MYRLSRSTTLTHLIVAATLTVVAGLAMVPDATMAASPTPFNVNLVRNPNAENGAATNGYRTVPIPNWNIELAGFTVVRYGASGFPTKAESARIGGGKKFFACGNAVEGSVAKQRIPMVGRQTLIDNGHIRANLKARIASYDSQQDYGSVFLQALDAQGTELKSIVAGPVEASDDLFILKQTSMLLPAGTVSLRVSMIGVRDDSHGPLSYCDAYFDNLSVVLKLV
jgi:hypothetical protein